MYSVQELARKALADYDTVSSDRLLSEPRNLTTSEAYALQAEIARLRERRGEKVIGYKVGCTSAAVQRQLGISDPIFARIFDTGCHPCGMAVSYQRYANLAVEGELAVRLGRDVPGSSSGPEECRAAIASAFPVIELHNYTLQSPQPSHQELVACGGMHAGFVLAEEEAHVGLPDLDGLGLWIDDQQVGNAAGADVTELAIRSVRWLAKRLFSEGLSLGKGAVVLTGSLLSLYPVAPGSRIEATMAPAGHSSAVIVQD